MTKAWAVFDADGQPYLPSARASAPKAISAFCCMTDPRSLAARWLQLKAEGYTTEPVVILKQSEYQQMADKLAKLSEDMDNFAMVGPVSYPVAQEIERWRAGIDKIMREQENANE